MVMIDKMLFANYVKFLEREVWFLSLNSFEYRYN